MTITKEIEEELKKAFHAGYLAGIKAGLIVLAGASERMEKELTREPGGQIND